MIKVPPGSLENVHAANDRFYRQLGAFRFYLLALAQYVVAAPRLLYRAIAGPSGPSEDRALQLPWMPRWPGLRARPLHDAADYPWTELLRAAHGDICRELQAVEDSFRLARYASDENPKPWNTFYLYLEGRPVTENLARCPRTAAVLARIPQNRFHVCFSAIEPGGTLDPHTGPSNASLTAHLGLVDCAGARLFVADRSTEYREGEVLVFDDSYLHWVEHGGPRRRYSLMITFWHPDLSWSERAFLGRVVQMAPK